MNNTNGNAQTAEAIAQAEHDALAQQDADSLTPHPSVPEPVAVPAEPLPMSPGWFTQMVAINAANLQQAQANAALKAKELREAEDIVQRLSGGLDALKALQAIAAQT